MNLSMVPQRKYALEDSGAHFALVSSCWIHVGQSMLFEGPSVFESYDQRKGRQFSFHKWSSSYRLRNYLAQDDKKAKLSFYIGLYFCTHVRRNLGKHMCQIHALLT